VRGGGGGGAVLRIYFLSERDGRQVTGGLTVLLIFKDTEASEVAKRLRRKYRFQQNLRNRAL
jgi:hypothetical protein